MDKINTGNILRNLLDCGNNCILLFVVVLSDKFQSPGPEFDGFHSWPGCIRRARVRLLETRELGVQNTNPKSMKRAFKKKKINIDVVISFVHVIIYNIYINIKRNAQ